MKNNDSYDPQEFDALVRQIDALTSGESLEENTPAYQNYSNGYGRPQSGEYRDYGEKTPSRAARAAGQTRRKSRRKKPSSVP